MRAAPDAGASRGLPDPGGARAFWAAALWTGLWAGTVVVALAMRPLLPIDETRYAAVAWEMWLGGDSLVPHLNGETYSHKPPVLFWLITAGWWVFGVSELWLRLVAPLSGLASLFATYALARLLWPADAKAARLAPIVVLGSLLFAVTMTVAMFDTLVTLFALVALTGIALARRRSAPAGWLIAGLAMGVGVLTKGPVILVFTLPAALLAPWWCDEPPNRGWLRWYLGAFAALAVCALVAFGWAVPAALAGGPDYGRAILWGQTTGRIADSFAHGRPLWSYVLFVPLSLLPWLIWPRLWRALRSLRWGDEGVRFCLAWAAAAFVLLSFISGKQPHYALPLIPALALIGSRALSAYAGAGRRDEYVVPGAAFAALGLAWLALAAWVAADTEAQVRIGSSLWAPVLTPWPGLILVGAGALAAVFRPRADAPGALQPALLMLLLVAVVHVFGARAVAVHFDLRPAAVRLAAHEDAGRPLAQLWKYHGQYHFIGRLERPIAILARENLASWLARHPDGRVIVYHREAPVVSETGPEFVQPFRSRFVAIWNRGGIGANPSLFE